MLRILTCLALTATLISCGDSVAPTGPDALATSDASSDASIAECSAIVQDCTAPLGCLWIGDETTDGTCRVLGGIQGIGRTPEGGDCFAHATCEPGLGCFNTRNEPPGTIAIGTCQALCLPNNPAQCTAPVQCQPIPNTTAVGYCF